MSFLSSRLPWFLVIAPLALLLTGCQATQARYGPNAAGSGSLQGHVMGGEQPITASTLQLYAVGDATDGGVATPLITATITSSDGSGQMNANANAGNDNNQLPAGSFDVTGDYTCPSPSTLVYLAAIGGNPGGGANDAQEELAGLGQCGNLSGSTNVTINEVSTVGTVVALHDYMTAYNSVGSTPAHAAALAAAFSAINEYVNIAHGTAPGPALPSGYYASAADLRALANAVQYCVNSTGSLSNGSNCEDFFTVAQGTAVNPPTDTVGALLDIFADPTNNVTTIFNLQGSMPAFSPTNAFAPSDWTLPILQMPSTPSISPNGGSFTTVQNVTITDADSDSTNAIYYTTDGSTPSAGSTLYTGPVTVSSSETINAIAIDDSRLTSPVASSTFTLSGIAAPTVSLASISAPSGSTTAVSITATGTDEGATVTFVTAGSIGGSFSPTTCTISSGSCSVSYTPSGSLSVGTYANDLTASFAAYGSYAAASATGTVTVSTRFTTTVLHTFTGGATDGQAPGYANLIQGTDGNFYGTTRYGGAHSDGTIFELTPNGTSSTFTLLYSFTGGNDGANPAGNLVQGADGNFYGMTYVGGAHSEGTIFELTPNGTSSTFTLLYSFTGGNDGANPAGNLVQGADGNFYGMTTNAGADTVGTVFELTPNGSSSTFTLLYTFTEGADGGHPYGSLVRGADGNFYGLTNSGGADSYGTVFELTPNGTSSTFTLLYTFTGGTDGATPNSSLVQGADGNFYGMTAHGGAGSYGTVFELTPNGTSSTFTLLHTFTGPTDGTIPYGSLVQGADGNFYGMTTGGGAHSDGTVFELTPNGTSSTFTLLHPFAGGADGAKPQGSLVQGADGNFYGMTNSGGAASGGTIFEVAVSPALAAPVTFSAPSTVTAGSTFNLAYAVANAYVASPNDGTLEQCFAGAYNSSGAYTKLGTFTGSPTSQNTTLTAPSTAGTYTLGVTCGGQESSTTTLTITQPSAAATPTFSPVAGTYSSAQSVTISSSAGASIYYTTDGSTPTTGSTLYTGAIGVASSETLNAIAAGGGFGDSAAGTAAYVILAAPTVSVSSISTTYGSTTPVMLTAASNATGSVVTFVTAGSIGGSFSPTTCTISSGSCSVSYTPSGSLSVGTYTNDLTAGFAAYGSYTAASATGTLAVTSSAPFTATVLHTFAGAPTDGQTPQYGNLIQGADGNFYGMTVNGGADYYGTIFELTPNGTFTLLYSFTGGADGGNPYGSLVQGADGNFYGMTLAGGAGGGGTIFELTPNGTSSTFTLLYTFTVGNDGANPYGNLVQGADGNFYGMTNSNGADYAGTVFELTPNGTSSTFTLLYTFTGGNDGANPYGSLVQGADGNFYGMTQSGGADYDGTIFELTPNGTSSTFTLLYTFTGGNDGANPYGNLVQGADGNFYGMTSSSGADGDGTVFELTPNGSSSTFTLLYTFTGAADGASPKGSLVQGADGNFYGMTEYGGAYNAGTVFELTPNGSSSTFTLLYTFTVGNDGANPYGNLVQGADGNFYGMTSGGGADGDGTVFEVAVSPALAAPVTLSAPSTVTAGASFTLAYAVANAYAASPYSGTLEQCFAGAYDAAGTYTTLGAFTASPTSQNTTLTAPSTAGTYTLGVTCGGQESSTTPLTVQ